MNDTESPALRSAPIDARVDEDETDDAMSSVLGAFAWGLARDVRIAMRSKADLGVQLLFYVLVVSLFPLSTSPSRDVLAMLGPGVLWTAALLASLLSLPRLFAGDFVDGTLEQIALSPRPLPALVLGKTAAHWLTTGLPVAVMAPLLGAIGAALTLGARGGGGLLALLVLPLYAPVLIFGAGAVDAVRAGMSASANVALLGAGLIIAVVALPFAAASAVRIALD